MDPQYRLLNRYLGQQTQRLLGVQKKIIFRSKFDLDLIREFKSSYQI